MNIDFADVVPKFDAILARGLSSGLGQRDGQMCIEAAWCAAFGLPHGDDPGCVDLVVRQFKIRLNDKNWSSPQARAAGLRDLGIAQLGSKGAIDGSEFARKLAKGIIRVLIPALFRDVFPTNVRCLAAADRCEREGTREAVREARAAAAYAAAADADAAHSHGDKYLALAATIALNVLRELKSPGAVWLDAQWEAS